MSVATSQVSGLVLAGGLSRRMFSGRGGAGDKGLLEIARRPMIAHVIDRLRPQVGWLAINANGDPARFAAFGLPVVADTVEGFVGPLAGILAGLRWAAGATPEARWIASVSSDAPFLPVDLVARLADAVRERGNAIAIAQSDDGLHPVIGLWPLALADDLEAALKSGLRKVLHWTDKHGNVPVAFDSIHVGDARVDPFFNANTPEELEEARRLMSGTERHGSRPAEEHR
jgi:molybdopterin-guanine dinucleotide biosynthesis protein A